MESVRPIAESSNADCDAPIARAARAEVKTPDSQADASNSLDYASAPKWMSAGEILTRTLIAVLAIFTLLVGALLLCLGTSGLCQLLAVGAPPKGPGLCGLIAVLAGGALLIYVAYLWLKCVFH